MARRAKKLEPKPAADEKISLERAISTLEAAETLPEPIRERVRGLLARASSIGEALQAETETPEAEKPLMTSEIPSEPDKGGLPLAILADQKATEKPSEVVPDSSKILSTLKSRFEIQADWHKGIEWAEVEISLLAHPEKLVVLQKMEEAGGKPDVLRAEGDSFVFADFCAESPKDRRNLNYREASEKVAELGAELMNEPQYRHLQTLGDFDVDLWCWIQTPEKVFESGDALRGGRKTLEKVLESDDAHRDDREGSEVCVNLFGALSRYDAGGFRCALKVPKA